MTKVEFKNKINIPKANEITSEKVYFRGSVVQGGGIKHRATKRSTVTIPHITESNSSIKLREKNRKIVSSLDKDRRRQFSF